MIKNRSPGTVDAVRGAEVGVTMGNLTKQATLTSGTSPTQAATLTRGKRSKTFADWVQSPAPYQLGLDPDVVARIARAMARPEMRGISTLGGLVDGLKWLQIFYEYELAWKRFLLSARYLWLHFKGKA